MEINELIEGKFVNVEFVKKSKSKYAVMITEGIIEEHPKFGKKLVVDVEIDGKIKKWSMNRPTMTNLAEAWGNNSERWVGHPIQLLLTKIEGKDVIVGIPGAD